MFSPWLLPSPVIQLLRTRTRFSGLSVLQVRSSGPRGGFGVKVSGFKCPKLSKNSAFCKMRLRSSFQELPAEELVS